ncbi:phage major capsid protein [Stenotrophomonas nematodicola]|uniref:phage major capsid protein n=1 Tax=Stenotrophomonas nematodicola TaxID=2656746 RepID=UPI0012919B45|nr:phage major capsid protein [Stenotrophomonas nematodicola]
MAQIDDDIKNINASLGQVNEQLKKHAEQAKADISAHAQLSEETKAKVDQLLTAQGELQANLQAAQQVIAKLEQGGGAPAKARTIGEVVATSDVCKNFNPGMQGSFTVKAAITREDASAGNLIEPHRIPGVVATPNQRLFLRDLLTWGTTTSDSLEYVRETGFTNNAEVVAENPVNPKPESDLAFELDSSKVATIAHWIRASKQVLRDAGMLQAYINGRLMYGLKLKEEGQLLKGSGVGLNINGLYTQATAYANPGVVVQNETAIDRIRIAMLQVTLAEYEADGIVLNPIDWTTVELSKTTENAYLFATPRGLAVPGLWARPVVATKAMDTGEFLTGAFKLGAQGWDREQAIITVSNQDRDNFVKNMVTILCEEDVGLTVFRPEAFVKGGFAGLPVVDGP